MVIFSKDVYKRQAYCYTGSYDYPSPTVTGSVGRDIALIDEVIGVKICISDHRYAGITRKELTKLAAAARVAGLVLSLIHI